MENTNINIDLLEQLKSDYSALKEKLDKQEIINDRLLASTFQAKVKDIHSVGWISSLCGVFVMLIAPFTFHYNPVMNLSWAFVIATEVMMAICILFNWYFHRNVTAPQPGEDLKTFAGNVKTMKKNYQNWIKFAFCLIAPWLGWMCTELIMKADDPKLAYFTIAGLLFGAAIGGIAGYRLDKKVLNRCDEIIADIEETE